MNLHLANPSQDARPFKVAAYLRVSTTRQADGDVSLPSQEHQIQRYVEGQGWVLTKVFEEAGASGTSATRPVLNTMLDEACGAEHPFDAILVHSYSRFFRDLVGQELAVARLVKAGVELISITQPSGKNPSEQMMRKLIAVFDEHQSHENSKNVRRAMRENAEQGFHNGATPPLGYKSVEAERRGTRSKRTLVVDEVEADIVRLIFALYLGRTEFGLGPLGIKKIVVWLNNAGYQTRKGKHFSVSQVHKLLTNPAYVGRAKYSVWDSKRGQRHAVEDIIEVSIPPIIDDVQFSAVQRQLAEHNPKVTAPRTVTGPVLLAGLAICASCGGGMQMRTGTSKTGKMYTYYTCSNRATKGGAACNGITISMPLLDELVLEAIEENLLAPDRLYNLLERLLARKRKFAANVNTRIATLKQDKARVETSLKNLYRLVETGDLGADEMLSNRILELRAQRSKVDATIERALEHAAPIAEISPDHLRQFGLTVREKLRNGDIGLRRNYLKCVVGQVIVDDRKVTLVGSTHALHAAITHADFSGSGVRRLVQEWRALRDSNS